jgi:DNA-binding FadR family transcriptional regulator
LLCQPTVPADAIAQRDPQADDTAMRAHLRQGLEKNLQD